MSDEHSLDLEGQLIDAVRAAIASMACTPEIDFLEECPRLVYSLLLLTNLDIDRQIVQFLREAQRDDIAVRRALLLLSGIASKQDHLNIASYRHLFSCVQDMSFAPIVRYESARIFATYLRRTSAVDRKEIAEMAMTVSQLVLENRIKYDYKYSPENERVRLSRWCENMALRTLEYNTTHSDDKVIRLSDVQSTAYKAITKGELSQYGFSPAVDCEYISHCACASCFEYKFRRARRPGLFFWKSNQFVTDDTVWSPIDRNLPIMYLWELNHEVTAARLLDVKIRRLWHGGVHEPLGGSG